jgi:ABC exporter DevB family membrane fusion protein
MDQQGLLVEKAERELAAAVALRRKTLESYQQSEAVAQAKRRAAEATFNRHLKEIPLESLKKNVELAEQRMKDGEIRSLGDGQVLRILARAGETSGQPILQLGDTTAMVVVAEVYETQVQTLRDWPNVSVSIRSPALLDQQGQERILAGELARDQIGRMIARNTAFSPDPREDRDRRVVEVQVRISDQDAPLAAQFVNLQVTVEFSKDKKAP